MWYVVAMQFNSLILTVAMNYSFLYGNSQTKCVFGLIKNSFS